MADTTGLLANKQTGTRAIVSNSQQAQKHHQQIANRHNSTITKWQTGK